MSNETIEKICELIRSHAGLPEGVTFDHDTDLYRAGMKSFSSVQLMLALEDAFEIEVPDDLLTRETFRSPAALHEAVAALAA